MTDHANAVLNRLIAELNTEIAAAELTVDRLRAARLQLSAASWSPDSEACVATSPATELAPIWPAVTVNLSRLAPEPIEEQPPGAVSRRRKYTLEQVAEIWNGHTDSSPARLRHERIAAELDITPKAASVACTRARAQGLIPPAATAASRSEAAANFDPDAVDWPAVADVYLSAVMAGRAPIQAIMDRFEIEREIAKTWPTVCRRMGLLPPFDRPQIEHEPAPQQVIRHTVARPSAL